MRKALVFAVLALLGSETLAQHGFRAPKNIVALDDIQDNNLMRTISSPNPSSYMGGGRGRVGFDDAQDNEMALDLRLPREPTYRIKFAEEDDELFTQGDMGRMSGFLGNGGSGLAAGGGSTTGGIAWGGAAQYAHNIGRNTQLIGGASLSHAPGSRVGINPHVGVKFSFDDAQDDELFTQGDMGRMSGFLGNGGSGLAAGGGSTTGGVAWGGAAQYAHNIGRNTQLIGGASLSHAPGSRVGINPHVGVKFSFDDAQDDELFAEDDELFTQGDLGRMSSPFLPGSGVVGGGGSVRGGVAMGGTGQLNLNVGRNTQLIGGVTASHAPGSRVNLAPHVGVRFAFDDTEN